jgi:fructoselysine-6-P-deglycase FrlB-like protein
MSDVAEEIASQPTAWRQAAALVESVKKELPPHGSRIALVGCGTSLYMAQTVAMAREGSGCGESDAHPASEFSATRPYDSVVAISRSGTTTEVVRALGSLPSGIRSLAVTAVEDSPLTRAAAVSIVMDFADERSVVQTRFATSVLALFFTHLGWDLEEAVSGAETAVSAPLPIDPTNFERFVFLGRGWTVGVANEAALKIREAAGAWSEAYPAMEYRHGPISAESERTVVWTFGAVDPHLIADVETSGSTVVRGGAHPLADLVLAQRTAIALAEARGKDPDHPAHLNRSVVLGSEA